MTLEAQVFVVRVKDCGGVFVAILKMPVPYGETARAACAPRILMLLARGSATDELVYGGLADGSRSSSFRPASRLRPYNKAKLPRAVADTMAPHGDL